MPTSRVHQFSTTRAARGGPRRTSTEDGRARRRSRKRRCKFTGAKENQPIKSIDLRDCRRDGLGLLRFICGELIHRIKINIRSLDMPASGKLDTLCLRHKKKKRATNQRGSMTRGPQFSSLNQSTYIFHVSRSLLCSFKKSMY